MIDFNCPIQGRLLIHAAAVVDGKGVHHAPGAILAENDQILASGPPESIGKVADGIITLSEPRTVVMPALVNAHAHLDLTHIGPIPPQSTFQDWIRLVMSRRVRADPEIEDSVRHGVSLSRAGGTALIGDIAGAGSVAAARTRIESGIAGVSYMEAFGLGDRQTDAIELLRRTLVELPESGIGAQPHAPYSCGPSVYRAATALGVPLCTHLHETPDELEFARSCSGPFRTFLESIGAWHDAITPLGADPLDALGEVWQCAPWLLAHVNYITESQLLRMADWPVSVAYCPRASAYFGHLDHPYRDMLARGINVALGTDSILCLDSPDRISVLDEMRFLHRRDGTDASVLLAMATINGAKALGFDSTPFTLSPGPTAGLLGVDCGNDLSQPLIGALQSDASPRWLLCPNSAAGRSA